MTDPRNPGRRGRTFPALKLLGLSLVLGFAGTLSAETAPTTEPAAAVPAEIEPSFRHVMTREGIEIELTLDSLRTPGAPLMEADSVEVRFEVRDTHTGEPLPSLYPAGWMDRLTTAAATARVETSTEDCREKVASFIGGSFLSRAELDLNSFYVLTLNDEPSISVVDPLFSFGGSKMLTTIKLPSRGADWAASTDQERLFITLPDRDQVAIAETASWKVVTYADTGPAPERIVSQPDGAFLWAAYDGRGDHPGGVSVISTTALKTVADVETGAGPHDLAFSADGAVVYVTNRGSGTVSVIDVATRETLTKAAPPSPLNATETGDGPV
ncbi:MAG: YncE family protein, partial [Acidobacteriota bacterium]